MHRVTRKRIYILLLILFGCTLALYISLIIKQKCASSKIDSELTSKDLAEESVLKDSKRTEEKSPIKAIPEEEKNWERAEHYNVDDYGVPVEEYVQTVGKLMQVSMKRRLGILKRNKIKTVLFYHIVHGSSTYGFSYDSYEKQGQLPYVMNGCKRFDCFCTDKKDLIPIEEFDAILFHADVLSRNDLPKMRKPSQRYILWGLKPPPYVVTFNPKNWTDFFNWTYTYRSDSDFWAPYGMISQIKPFPKDVDTLIKESVKDIQLAFHKKLSVAWIVSNCRTKSQRETFFNKLSTHIEVDIYGQCGYVPCNKGGMNSCWGNIERIYHFYFSGENSLCKDYVTESFYNAMTRQIIPITFGGGSDRNEYLRFAPKHSYIDAFDYKSPKQLAKYLLYLQEHPEEYVKYFWWKPYYKVWFGRKQKPHCEICDKLHEDNNKTRSYDLKDWWMDKANCRPKYL